VFLFTNTGPGIVVFLFFSLALSGLEKQQRHACVSVMVKEKEMEEGTSMIRVLLGLGSARQPMTVLF